MSNHEEVKRSIAKEYPEYVRYHKEPGKKCFDIAALMRKKGYIK